MSRTADAYNALIAAIEDETPACRGDARFTADAHPLDVLGELQLVCSACPVFAACRAFAVAAKPPSGVWAGERWDKPRRPGRPSKRKEVA